jgi:hypothetical protein
MNCDQFSASICKSTEFHCGAGFCINKSYQCDGEPDCDNESDEKDCSKPIVIKPPTTEIHALIGSDITLDCEAVGNPIPVISWRKNWGHTCPGRNFQKF